MKLKFYTVDAFTSKPFEGNPAAIVPLLEPLPEELMQKIAFEMNLSETAYVRPTENSSGLETGNRFSLRWFTPKKEVNLCGHATLATAHILFNILGNPSTKLEFETLSGVLYAEKQDKKIVLDFPNNLPEQLTEPQKQKFDQLVRAIAGDMKVKDLLLSPTAGKLLVRLDDCYSRKDLESLDPNPQRLLEVNDGSEVKGVIASVKGNSQTNATSGESQEHDFFSRYFAPWVGIAEDPVTGSAHTVLGPYWAKELGRQELKCRQCSPRGGELNLRVREDGRVDIIGEGQTVIVGEINV